MKKFHWSEDYLFGFPQIDEQHKKLFDIAREFHEAIIEGKGPSVVTKILEQLFRYSLFHFEFEGHFLVEWGYSNCEQHLAEHALIIEKLNDHARKIRGSQTIATIELRATLEEWLLHHVLESDRGAFMELRRSARYQPWLRELVNLDMKEAS